MQNQTLLGLIRKYDPSAVCLMNPERDYYYRVKRVLDFVGAAILLTLLSPLMFLIGILIFIYSPGPIFFSQERVGSKRKSFGEHSYWKRINFRCYKFRTMKVNADSSTHKAYVKALIENDQEQMNAIQGEKTEIRKLVRDSRIIHPGWLLRKLSLDELPQLWNVLRGEMSLVGPRPAIPYEVEMYKSWHLKRLEAQPGITGLQQITARCAADFDEQVHLDLKYIENQSFWLDVRIILKTPWAIISTKGAR